MHRNYTGLTTKKQRRNCFFKQLKKNSVGPVQGFKPGGKVDLIQSMKPR